jgi:hypothetical protein
MRRTTTQKDLPQGQVEASSTHVFAVQATPLAQDPVFVHPTSHCVCPHETLPPHDPAPLQQMVLVPAPLWTIPEHEGDPLHAMLHVVCAVHVTLPLHA